MVYVTIKDTTWEAMAHGNPYNSGTYTCFSGAKVGQWSVGTGGHTGDTGLAIIGDDGKMLIANFANTYSDMNGTFTKLNTGLTLEGTWISTVPIPLFNDFVKIVAETGSKH